MLKFIVLGNSSSFESSVQVYSFGEFKDNDSSLVVSKGTVFRADFLSSRCALPSAAL